MFQRAPKQPNPTEHRQTSIRRSAGDLENSTSFHTNFLLQRPWTTLQTSPGAAEAQADAIATRLATPEAARPGELPPGLKTRLGRELGFDFSRIKIHSDAEAAARTAAFHAEAFCEGTDIFFAPGRWRPETPAGSWLAAHEAVHAAQFGFARPGLVSAEPRYFQKGAPKAFPDDIVAEVKKRTPDLAVFIDLKTINDAMLGNTVEGPKVSGGTAGTDVHEWHISLTLSEVTMSSQTAGTPIVTTKKTKTGNLIKHVIPIVWGTLAPLGSGPQATKAAEQAAKQKALPKHARGSKDYAFELAIAEPLIHELLHARIVMERDPSFAASGQPHTKLAQGYFDMIAASQSPAVKKERDAVHQKLTRYAAVHSLPKGTDLAALVDSFDEFLVHEKYDIQTVYGVMGYSGDTNQKIAEAYVKTVGTRLGPISVSDAMEANLRVDLTKAVCAYYNAIDKQLASATQTTAAPASPSTSARPGSSAPTKPNPATK